MSNLAIVEKKPPLNGGGCAGGVLFHLLDWHRRLARKRRIFSPRRLLLSSLRSAPRRLPAPPPPTPTPPPAPNPAAADGTAPGVVARLMGLESWPGGSAGGSPGAPPRPQKQRKVEPSSPEGDSAVVLVLPTSRRPPAPALSPASAPRSHHGSDLPARSPRRTRLVHAAAAKLLEPRARASSRASARLALAYACSSPQHRKDGGHSGTADDFLSRSGSMSLERSTRFQFQPPPVPVAETECDRAAVSRRHEHHSIDSGDAVIGTGTVVLPRMDFGVSNVAKSSSSDGDGVHKERRLRNEGISTCAKVRSSISSGRTGDERLRKRGTPTRPDVSAGVNPMRLASSTGQFGQARALASAGRRPVAHNSSGARRELISSVTGQRNTNRRDVINQSGLASTSRSSNNGPGPKRVSRKNVGHVAAASNTGDSNAVAFASRSSKKPVGGASSHSIVSKSGRPSRRASNTTCARMLAADPKYDRASASFMATSEKDEFSRLLKAKIDELGMSDRMESSEAISGGLPAPVLQELISALTNDTNTSTSQSTSNYHDASAPLHSNGNVGCIDQSGYAFSDVQSPYLQKCYQGEQDVDSSAASINNEPNQPSPVSVLEACFSNDTSSLGSPVEKNEVKDLLLSVDNKMELEDLFNLEADITKAGAEDIFHGNGILSCLENFVAHDFKFLESRLHNIGEALSNVELLLGSGLMQGTTSAFALRPFIMEMLETSAGVFGGEEILGVTEEKQYQHTNFLFDCIVESLDSKFRNFGKCGYKAWLKLSLLLSKAPLSKDLLKRELLEVIDNWKESGAALSRVADKELDQVTTSWDECQIEVFDISVAVEDDILEALVVELALDLW